VCQRAPVTVDLLYPGVRDALNRLGLHTEVMPCDPELADTAAFCAAYGVDPGDSANCIVVAGKAEPRVYCACLVLATTRLDVNRVVTRLLGVRKASFASAEETREVTGMLIGGVTPFGLPDGLPVYVDGRVMTRPSVVVGGGTRSAKLRLAPGGLRRIPGVEVVEGLAADPLPA
jgi:prolyl-tRNA editing enzyme YbaK/EbsC (Cys-tRNA(Pro) deacylase)